MPRTVTPGGSGGPITPLEDDEPYTVTLVDAKTQTGPDYNDPTKQSDTIVFTFGVSENPEDTLMVWASPTLGKNRTTGKVSKNRAILNALAGKAEDTDITGFTYSTPDEDASYSWKYADGSEFELEAGMTLVVRGTNSQNAEGYNRYTVDKFRSATKVTAAVAPAAAGGLKSAKTANTLSKKSTTTAADVPF